MGKAPEVRRLRAADAEAAFANRLRALTHAPGVFRTTLAEEREEGPHRYAALASLPDDEAALFGVFHEEAVVGLVGLARSLQPKIAHRALLWGMYVDVDHRRQGVGVALVDHALEHARRVMRATHVELSLLEGNPAAQALYEARGFVVWGRHPKALRDTSGWRAELHMTLEL